MVVYRSQGEVLALNSEDSNFLIKIVIMSSWIGRK